VIACKNQCWRFCVANVTEAKKGYFYEAIR